MSNETANNLRRNVARILSQWEGLAYDKVLSAFGLTSLVLNNAIESFLADIADALTLHADGECRPAAKINEHIVNFAKIHGGGRATEPLHYTLAEVILEFQILERVVLEVLEEQAPIPIADRKIIASTIDKALSTAATQFTVVHQQAQEQYALMLVHDLRSPVNIVKMGAQLIKRDSKASKTTTDVADKIDKHMDRLESMLKELLDASKIRAGVGRSFEFREFRLDELAVEVVKELKESHGERFELHTDEATSGNWNRAGLRRVLENLIVNALKYSLPESIVTVAVTQTATHALFTVHNEGNPIPAEERPHLFEQFQRGTTAKLQSGWGLGLALVNGMVKAHRGTVRIESTQEKGTLLIVELPKKP